MLKKLLFLLLLLRGLVALGQICPVISYPLDGETDIPVDATITWSAVDGINGYLVSLGTTPGGVDILNKFSTGLTNSYTAPLGLPENTTIYISVSLALFDGPPIVCPGQTFRTIDVTAPPPCTLLIAPDNNAINVTIVTEITWAYAPTATGYRLSIGTVPGGGDILNNLDVGNVLTYKPPEDLPQDAQIFVQITPTNDNGAMASCTEESFTTGPAPFICDPIIDPITGETTVIRPEISFPDLVGICSDELPFTVSTNDTADGFRWFKINLGSPETLLSESTSLDLTEPGRYRYEAYNFLLNADRNIECASSKLFDVVTSAVASIEAVIVEVLPEGLQITIKAGGIGNYEYALEAEGPYQDSPVFSNLLVRPRMAYVRDKNGCGVAQRTIDRDLSFMDFPNFFTPNGDGINDFWQFLPPPENFEIPLKSIAIFDRYGILLTQIEPKSLGWDGNVRGQTLPASDYWFLATLEDGRELSGHFALKR